MSEILEILKGVSPEDIRRDLERVRAERARLAAEEELLERVLALHAGDGGQDERPGGARFNRRDEILALLAQNPDRAWKAAEIIAALRERGRLGSEANLRVLLRRMVDRGQLERPAYGMYQLAATDPDADAPVEVDQ